MVSRIRAVEVCLGPSTLDLDEAESEYRREHKKCPVARRPLAAGHELTYADLAFKRTGKAVDFVSVTQVVGRRLAVPVPANVQVLKKHLR